MSHIISISKAVPQFAYNQKELENYYVKATESEEEKRKIRFVGNRSGIERRYSVLPDFGKKEASKLFHPDGKSEGIAERMALFESAALHLSMESVKGLSGFDSIRLHISHIITVTCTGLSAPGLDIALARELELSPRIDRNSINFMGCNAAVLALKQADYICRANPEALVLVVCTELCTLHFQRDFSDDYILSNSLFSDGSAAALIGNKNWVSADRNALKMEQFHSLLLHQGKKDMTWQISENGFRINLSSYVSHLICDNIAEMLHDLNISTLDFQHWAIHPGGPKILDDFCKVMNLDKNKLSHSYEVLKHFGNMSSATLLFVLSDLLKNKDLNQPGERIFAAAFGPGLSIESMTLAYV